MFKKIYFLISLIFLTLLLSGCWSKRELNELAIVSGLGIDKGTNGYKLTIQVVIPGEIQGKKSSGSAPVTIYKAEDKSICVAFRKISQLIPRKPYLAHLYVTVIAEEVAKEGIADFLDCFARDNEIRPTSQILIAKDVKAFDVFNTITTLDRIPSNNINEIIINSEASYSISHTTNLYDVMKALVSDGKSAIIPGITVLGDKEKGSDLKSAQKITEDSKLSLTSYAVFKKDKFIGWLDDEISKGSTHIKGKVKGTMFYKNCDEDKYLAYQVNQSRTKIKAVIENDKPKIVVEHNLEGIICQADCIVDFMDEKEVKRVSNEFAEVIKELLQKTIKTAKEEYKTDIFGFGEVVHRKDPKLWKKLSENWDEHFEKLETEVKVKVEIKDVGQLLKSFKKDVK